MKTIERIKTQSFKVLEAAFPEHKRGTVPKKELLKKILTPHDGGLPKSITALLRLIHESLPGVLDKKRLYHKLLYSIKELPINPKDYFFSFSGKIGSGAESDVYLLESKRPEIDSLVIKIYYSLEEDLTTLGEIASSLADEYEHVRELYHEIPSIILPEHTLILKGPQLRKKAIAIIQKFVGKELKDFFEIPKDDLLKMVSQNEQLRFVLRRFIEITLNHERSNHEIVDITGENNLALVQKNGITHLILLDTHLVGDSNYTNPKDKELLLQRLGYLESLAPLLN